MPDVLPSIETSKGACHRRWSRIRRWLKILAATYLGILLLLALFQRSLIYHPFAEQSLPATSAGFPAGQAHDVLVQTEDLVDLHGWLIKPKRQDSRSKNEPLGLQFEENRWLVLYFGGNAANRGYRLNEVRLLTALAADVLIVDYRGYGDSSGSPTEEGLAQDARAIWTFATKKQHVPPNRIVLFGESLGGGVAVRLASELCRSNTPPAGLILRSTFNSLVDAAASHFAWIPTGWLMVDRFPSDQRIGDLVCPLLQFHGQRDQIVPFRLGQKLFDAAPAKSSNGIAKSFVALPNADHNDVIETSRHEVSDAVTQFLARLPTKPQAQEK